MQSKPILHLSDRCAYFFGTGLNFTCQGCGGCCTGEPGVVSLTQEELDRIAKYLVVSRARLEQEAVSPDQDGFVVHERLDNACWFYDQGCTIYPVRPSQCRSFPFWVQNLRSRYAWNRVSRECPGIGQGRHFSREEILEILHTSPI